jgi:hypothetical protein
MEKGLCVAKGDEDGVELELELAAVDADVEKVAEVVPRLMCGATAVENGVLGVLDDPMTCDNDKDRTDRQWVKLELASAKRQLISAMTRPTSLPKQDKPKHTGSTVRTTITVSFCWSLWPKSSWSMRRECHTFWHPL